MDQPTEPVQPEEGQGGGQSEGGSPWEHYLERFPEDARDTAASVLREQEANATRGFQEAAEFRKAWEPYEPFREQLGDPAHVQQLLQLRDVLTSDNPQQAQEWWQSYAQERGLTVEQAQQQQAAQPQATEDWMLSDEDRVAKLLDERLNPLQEKLSQYDQRWEQQEFEARKAEWNEFFDGQLTDLKGKHQDDFAIEGAEDWIVRASQTYLDDDPRHALERGFQDWQQLRGSLEKSVLTQKASDPLPAEGGGMANAAPETPQNFDDAKAQALEHMRAIKRAQA